MKNYLLTVARAVAIAAIIAAASLFGGKADAQVVTQLPVYLNNNVGQVYDFGNGPLEFRIAQGSAQLWTMQGSATSQTVTASTSITLNTSVAANPPCVGCAITGTGLTTQTVTAFNGTTGITISAVATIVSGTTLSFGVACPTTLGANPALNMSAGVQDLPFYTTARICGASQFSAGGVVLPFAIGAH
jgi:hypothetical protein